MQYVAVHIERWSPTVCSKLASKHATFHNSHSGCSRICMASERQLVGQAKSASFCAYNGSQSCTDSLITKSPIGFHRRACSCSKCRRKLSQCKSYRLFVLYLLRLVLGVVSNKKSSTQLVYNDGKPISYWNCFSCFASGKYCIVDSSLIIGHLIFLSQPIFTSTPICSKSSEEAKKVEATNSISEDSDIEIVWPLPDSKSKIIPSAKSKYVSPADRKVKYLRCCCRFEEFIIYILFPEGQVFRSQRKGSKCYQLECCIDCRR